jgi:hypothetical protein
MGLRGKTIHTWDEMRQAFLWKYQEYYKAQDLCQEIFKMTQKGDESLEYYAERFQYNLQRSKQSKLNKDTLQTISIRFIQDECMDILNLMGRGDISNLGYDAICEMCKIYSRGNSKHGKDPRYVATRIMKSTGGGVTLVDIGNLLDNFKMDILGSLSSQFDTL